jgi:hypothetical protein
MPDNVQGLIANWKTAVTIGLGFVALILCFAIW